MDEYIFTGIGDILFYEGRYWLPEKYDSEIYGGWFASPVYETKDGLEVRPSDAKWIYRINGADIAKFISKEQKQQIIKSWIAYLKKMKIVEGEVRDVQTQN